MGSSSMAKGERGGTDGENLCWSYREIIERGSEELLEVIALITGGYAPGIPIKEEKGNGTTD